MSWLEKLKALFNIEINSPIISININSENISEIEKPYLYIENEKKVNLYHKLMNEEQKNKMKEITKEYINERNKLLKIDTSQLLYDIKSYIKNREKNDIQILNFFNEIIPLEDLEALEASLYLKNAFKMGKNISKLKQDIRRKYGDRGNNISNLCSSGYFETFLTELYNISKEEFAKIYELLVSNVVLTVFVHKQMSSEEVALEIKKKLDTSLRYGINVVYVHGIGQSNIEKIKVCIEQNKKFFNFLEKNIYEEDNVIMVELLIN